ncbi:hypothetical protein [Planobispora rosea]|uniref:hypothetical protein n=1 Tax=Planobispora rosea TaxID=35762 RepID=UPI00114CE02C|nr:hypothetical protein [Planobispora rosea]
MNIARTSLLALMAGVLTGCTFTVDADVTAGAEATVAAKAPGSFGEPFPEKLFTMDRVSVVPAAEGDVIPDGAQHKITGKQLTVTYRSDEGPTAGQQITATGAQAQVTDLKAALDALTEKAGKPTGARTDWVPVNPGVGPAAAACQNLAEGEGTRCYWVDADTVGYLHMSKEAAPYIPFDKTRLALEDLEKKN